MQSKSTCNPLESVMISINESHYIIIISPTVTVSAIFGITWLPDVILYVVDQTNSLKHGAVIFLIVHAITMSNSAVNPFVYTLINKRFREKMKSMLCRRRRKSLQSDSIELVNSNVA